MATATREIPLPKPRLHADQSDPRCIDYAGGLRWGKLFDDHRVRTGESMKVIAANVGIGVENLYAYQRGHQTPQPTTTGRLMRYLTGAQAPQGVSTSKVIDGDYLVITTRIPLSEITA